jgi:phosphoribosyl-dephospho-CoA transferase
VCQSEWIEAIVTPSQLLHCAVSEQRADTAPAFRALETLKDRWKDLSLTWGPGGSVGFELATAIPVVKPESDLDIVIYAGRPIAADQASALCGCANGLAAPADIRVETPSCGFSLREYASNWPAPILLRTAAGMMLGDPWESDSSPAVPG